MVVVESAGLTDVGRKRKGNEDALLIDEQMNLFIVADGMGGHQAGEVASKLVVQTIREYMERFQDRADMVEPEVQDDTLSQDANRLISGIYLSNRVVHQASRSKKSYQGMGSTVSAVCFTEDTIIATNVGDSPIFLIRDGKIERLSVTHTVYAEQMALAPEAGRRFGKEFSHVLTRAMGIDESVKADICELQCFKGDSLVIGSDGLSDKVRPEEILKLIKTQKKPEKICRILVDMANDRGGDDNITVIVLNVKSVVLQQSGFQRFLSRLKRMFH